MRVEYPGAIYHVMDRGDRREDIFLDDIDRQEFLMQVSVLTWHCRGALLKVSHVAQAAH
jgi:hypothetical protein